MTRRRVMINRMLLASPWLTVIVLLGMAWALPNRVAPDPRAELRKQQVAAAMNAVPFFIGKWVGTDVALPREAQKLLRPNATFSREYHATDTPPVRVLFIHCGDTRDMIGHYPPICYPSSGWIPMGEPSDLSLRVNGRDLPVREYRFSLMSGRGQSEGIRIFNTFLLPNGAVASDIGEVDRSSERLTVAVQGVAQMQVITAATISHAQAVDAANELLAGMSPLFQSLGWGRTDES